LTPEVQGYYFAFGSLLALQSFVELGFSLVITQFASHEWAQLKLEPKRTFKGSAEAMSRFISLGQLSLKWYGASSCIFIGAVGAGGYLFFWYNSHDGVNWTAPWLALTVLSGLQLWLMPLLALL